MTICGPGLLGLAAMAMIGAGAPAVADGWPDGPVTMIVPWGAGDGADSTARIIASLLERERGVPVTVENRTGGSGVTGHTAIADAAPDEQTIDVATRPASSWRCSSRT